MRRIKYTFIIAGLLILLLMLCIGRLQNVKRQTTMSAQNLHNGDAKFFNDSIITNINGKMTFLDLDGSIIHQYKKIKANWIDVIEKDRVVIYGNDNCEIGIAVFDQECQLLSNQIIMKTEHLQIDPTIIKVGDCYFATITEINGCINNANPNAENGLYTIHFYQSENLSKWTLVCDIISEKNNLEDAELFYQNHHFYLVYEKEQVDKGNSQICLLESLDASGTSWKQPKILLSDDCDHEPARILRTEDGYTVFYSSDKDKHGQSYMGSKMYYAQFDRDFNLLNQDIEIPSETKEGILLYDVRIIQEQMQLLYAGNYLTNCDLIVEEKPLNQ